MAKIELDVKIEEGLNLAEATGIDSEHFSKFMNRIDENDGYESTVRGVMDALKDEENLNVLIAATVTLYNIVHMEAVKKSLKKVLGLSDEIDVEQ